MYAYVKFLNFIYIKEISTKYVWYQVECLSTPEDNLPKIRNMRIVAWYRTKLWSNMEIFALTVCEFLGAQEVVHVLELTITCYGHTYVPTGECFSSVSAVGLDYLHC